MLIIRLAFWLGLVVLLLPADEEQQVRLYRTATTSVERVTTFCDRNAKTCATAVSMWSTFLKKAEFGARLAVDVVTSRTGAAEESPGSWPGNARAQPEYRTAPAPRGTLTPTDLGPAWRTPGQRAGL